METFTKVVGGIVLVLAILLLYALILGFPVKWLWNATMPELFDLKRITFTQALWLNLLTGILFRTTVSKGKD